MSLKPTEELTRLLQIASNHIPARIVQGATQAKYFDTFADGPKTLEEFQKANCLSQVSATRMIGGLVALGVLEKQEADQVIRFYLPESCRPYLLSTSPKFLGPLFAFESLSWPSWGHLNEVLKKGEGESKAGQLRARLLEDPTYAQLYAAAGHAACIARDEATATAKAIDLSEVELLLDFGCGYCGFSVEFLKKYPELSVVALDLPHVIDAVKKDVETLPGVGERISFTGSDYLEEKLGVGQFDMVFSARLLHLHDDDENLKLLEKMARALKPKGRIVIRDHIMSADHCFPLDSVLLSMFLAVHEQGKVYTYAEISGLLNRAGFKEIQIQQPTPPSNTALISAVLK